MIAIVSLLIVLTMSILITRVATVALIHTGISRQSAKFQARSAFTGVGFTTNESEKVVNHPLRRKILLVLMLLGNASIVTAVTSLILTFVDLKGSQQSVALKMGILIAGIIALWVTASSKWLDRHLLKFISRILKPVFQTGCKGLCQPPSSQQRLQDNGDEGEGRGLAG